ncbi:hypothetical protein HUG15_15630 [Salicibibacter cibarius]|uniref:Uncharacterized protein n=1 Tax=Salicibibacter cibarius TaxID=2743000 RepID=A0A7T6Z4V6_9BACI|nr:hypothetical protein HUG15_15630 [Salicibibacter cibarius]
MQGGLITQSWGQMEEVRSAWLPHGDRTSDWLSCSVAMNCFMATGEPASQETIRSLTIAFDTLTRAAAV